MKISRFFLVYSLIIAGLAGRVSAQTTPTLLYMSNHSFETPNLNGTATGEQFTGQGGNNILYPIGPAGWTFAYAAFPTTAGNGVWGCQDPNQTFYGQAHPLPVPFDGNQIAFFNLGQGTSPSLTVATATSDFVGTPTLHVIQANKIYTAKVTIGARANSAQRNCDYGMLLIDSTGAALGTTVTQTLDPDAAVLGNIHELTFMVNTNQVPWAVGNNLRMVVRVANTGVGGTGASTQANFDNTRITVQDAPPNSVKDWTIY